MAQSGYTPILVYASGTTGNTPSASNLTSSASGAELALNYYDGKLFYKDASGNVQVLASKAGNVNVSSLSFGTTGLTPNTATTGAITVAGTLATTNGGTGLTSFTANEIFYASSTSAFAQSTNLQFNGTTLTLANDASIHGLTVGQGAGSVSTNTVVGNSALAANTSGAANIAIGEYSLQDNLTGGQNISVGRYALSTITSISQNVAMGNNALSSLNDSGSGANTGIGHDALQSTSSGSYNTALGAFSLYSNTTASNNTAVGYQAGYTNSTGAYVTFVGWKAGYGSTANYGTAFGAAALNASVTGENNSAFGNSALYANSSGAYNVAVGGSALVNNTTASNNTAVGYQAGYSSTSANNTYIGYQAGYNNISGVGNTFIGYLAGQTITGSNNIVLGYSDAITNSGSNCIYIGYALAAGTSSSSHELILSTLNVTGKGANTGYITANGGSGNIYQGNNSSSWSTTSDFRLKKNIVDNNVGLDAINKIQVRNFEYRLPEEVDSALKPTDAINVKGVQLGVIAQELQQVLPDCVKQESTGVLSVDPDDILWHLVNAVKQLSAEVETLKSKLGA